jgi:hypothetical protein
MIDESGKKAFYSETDIEPKFFTRKTIAMSHLTKKPSEIFMNIIV